MGKKPQRFGWPEAKKRCRLNQLDIEMAKRLGFGPDALIHAIPDPKQKWKLPVKQWVHELHFKRFGNVLGEKPMEPVVVTPMTAAEEREAARIFEEEFFWDDYWDRNEPPKPKRTSTPPKPQQQAARKPAPAALEITHEDVPF
jgi:hypothetical protein